MPLSLVLDATVLHGQVRFESTTFRALERLVEAGDVRVLLPEVVYREVVSQVAENQAAKLLEAERTLKEALRWLAETPDIEEIERARTAIARVQERLSEASASHPLDDWMRRLDVTTLAVKPDHLSSALHGYFRGSPPFRKRRSREDLPDGLILESVREAAGGHANVRVISGDQRLREAASTVPGVVVFPKLADFFASDEVHTLIQAANAAENLARLGTILLERRGAFVPQVSRALVEALDHYEVESPSIPEDNQTATIQSVYEPTDLQLAVNEMEFLGEGSVLVPMTAQCDVEVYYCIFKSEYYVMDDERTKSLSISDWNDHYFMATEMLSVTVNAPLSIELGAIDLSSAEVLPADLARAVDGASYSIDEVESVELEEAPT